MDQNKPETQIQNNIGFDCCDKHLNSHKSDQTALVFCKLSHDKFSEQKLTYTELTKLSNQFANILEEINLTEGDRIIIQLRNRPEFIISFLGAIKAKIIPIPASPLLTPTEIDFLVTDSNAQLLITESDLITEDLLGENLGDLEHIISIENSHWDIFDGIYNWNDLMELSAPLYQPLKVNLNDPAYWLYTSGTQGQPKAVVHAHRSIPAHDERVKIWQNFKDNDLVFNTSSLNWSYSLTCAVLDILRQGGSTLIFEGKLNSENIFKIIKNYQPQIFMSVPTIYNRLLKDWCISKDEYQCIHTFISAGEKLNPEVKKEFKEKFSIQIQEGLGMTEHSVYLIETNQDHIPFKASGKPLTSTHIEILDDHFKPVSTGQVGILASHESCPGMMLGYYNREKGFYRPFKNGWFLSGDLAYRDEEGYIYFVGRNDDMITAGGYKISPLEIENHLNSHPHISESAVTPFLSDRGNQLIQAHIVLLPQAKLTETDILSHCQSQLAKYKVPHQIYFLDQLPKTKNGKIKRKDLCIDYYSI